MFHRFRAPSIQQAFQPRKFRSVQVSSFNDELAEDEEGVDLSVEDFANKLWLLPVTLLLIVVSGKVLVDRERLEKLRKLKSGYGGATES